MGRARIRLVNDFAGKVAVVTGGASGIGRACSLAFARLGSDIVVADLNDGRMASTVREVEALGRRALAMRTDVSKDLAVEDLARTAIAEMGHVDLVMNNAGVVLGGPVEKITMSDWEWILGINLFGVIRGCRAFLPHLLERGSGHIVNTASFAGLMAHNPLTIPYDTSKFGVMGLSQGLALYLRPRGVGVSVLCPGYIQTNLGENRRMIGMEEVAGPSRVADRVTTVEELAERVVEAVLANRFLVLSQPEHLEIVVRRWQDIDSHIDRQIRAREREVQPEEVQEEGSRIP